MMNKTKLASLLPIAGAVLLAGEAQASFVFGVEDMMLGFRKSGTANSLEVNIGDRDLYRQQNGGSFAVGGFSLSELEVDAGFNDLNSVRFSAFSSTRATDAGITDPVNTIWTTRARANNAVQTTPWNRNSGTAQGNTTSRIRAIGTGAVANGGGGAVDPSLVLANANTASYATQVGASGNWNGTFQGNVEATTSASFESGNTPVRLDLYELTPGGGAGLFLGFFEFSNDGSLSFTAVPEASTYGAILAGGIMLMALGQLHRKNA